MIIALGIAAGLLGFLPLFLSMRLSRRLASTKTLSLGLCGLGGACISLIILVVLTVICGINARGQIVGFTVAEGVTFLAITIAYVIFKQKFGEIR